MDDLHVLIFASLLVALSYWQRSTFLQIIAGVVTICFGAYWMTLDPSWLNIVEGTGAIAVGIYMLITTGFDLFRER